jgi:hypothetical protein
MTSSNRRWIHRACMVVIGLLYVASVPWYRDPDEPLTLWLGMPDWVTVAVLCYAAVAVVNGIAWTLTDVPDSLEESDASTGTAPMPEQETIR